MKELSIEEKAKAYDELLIKLQKAKVDNNVCDERYCCVIDDIVPELKESDDEKVRKTLISFFEDWGKTKSHCWNVSVRKIVTWLEKKGEKKHQYKSRPRYVEEAELLGAKKQELLKQELLKKENALKNSPFVEQKPVPKFEVGDVMGTIQGGLTMTIRIYNTSHPPFNPLFAIRRSTCFCSRTECGATKPRTTGYLIYLWKYSIYINFIRPKGCNAPF